MRTRLRFGVLGTASIVRRRVLPALPAPPGPRPVAVAGRDAAGAARTAREFMEPVTGCRRLLARAPSRGPRTIGPRLSRAR